MFTGLDVSTPTDLSIGQALTRSIPESVFTGLDLLTGDQVLQALIPSVAFFRAKIALVILQNFHGF